MGFESKSVTDTSATTDKNDPFLIMGFKHGKKWVDKNGAICNVGIGRITKNTLHFHFPFSPCFTLSSPFSPFLTLFHSFFNPVILIFTPFSLFVHCFSLFFTLFHIFHLFTLFSLFPLFSPFFSTPFSPFPFSLCFLIFHLFHVFHLFHSFFPILTLPSPLLFSSFSLF